MQIFHTILKNPPVRKIHANITGLCGRQFHISPLRVLQNVPSCPQTVVTGREGNKSTNFLVPQVSSVICSVSLLAKSLVWSPDVVCGQCMPVVPTYLAAWMGTSASDYLPWLPLWSLMWSVCSNVSRDQALWALNSEKCLVAQPNPAIREEMTASGSRVPNAHVCFW